MITAAVKEAKHRINIQIKRRLGFTLGRRWVKDVIVAVLTEEDVCEPVEVDCVITDNSVIQKLNRTYRRIDSPTDVLSFSLSYRGTTRGAVVFPAEPAITAHLGCIVISYSRAVEQAHNLGHDVMTEMRLLIVHGTLHLLGYDHENEKDERKMRARERALIKRTVKGK